MMQILSAIFLVAGAGICLIAAIGVLRLPDFFMRMHAATKAGVAGAGLVLIGVAFAAPSAGMWVKVGIAILFLLLTTPIAGHLLARAGYVAGVPLWSGTREDRLKEELERGLFDRPAGGVGGAAGRRTGMARVLVGLTHGDSIGQAVRQAAELARRHRVPLVGLAIVDTRMLSNVGPVPVGGNYYAGRMRDNRIEKARHRLADAVQTFERVARDAGVAFSLLMEEGDPATIVKAKRQEKDVLLIGRHGWFDHGVSGGRGDPLGYLVRRGVFPVVSVAADPGDVRSIVFVHDGSVHSDRALQWLVAVDPWPDASIHLVPDASARPQSLETARRLASGRLRPVEIAGDANAVRLERSQVVIFGNEGHAGWMEFLRAPLRPRHDDVPIVVFG
ncbi:MAG: monovalent cation/H(+) antiporter subunit G [Reyranellaceae bacterium]